MITKDRTTQTSQGIFLVGIITKKENDDAGVVVFGKKCQILQFWKRKKKEGRKESKIPIKMFTRM